MRRGYQLAFRTRSSGPRTWFNFERDILYLMYDDNLQNPNNWLSGGAPWDLGQFDPAELRKVRRLALSRSAPALDEHILYLSALWYKKKNYIMRVLELLERVRELFLGIWEQGDLVGRPQLHVTPDDARKDPLRLVPIDGLDGLVLKCMGVNLAAKNPKVVPCPGCDVLDLYMKFRGDQENVMPTLLPNMENCLRCERGRRLSKGSAPRWKVPRIICSHVLRSSTAEALDRGWRNLSKAAAQGRSLHHLGRDRPLEKLGSVGRAVHTPCFKKLPPTTSKFMVT